MVCASREKTDKIAGGFVLVPVVKLLHAWQACRKAPLRTADFRAWLACHEMVARRCHVHRDRDRSPRFGVAELAKLAGSSERRARASVRRLVGAGLIEWSDEAVTFPDLLDGNLEQPLDAIGGGQGSLAIPRRMLRFLANGATAAMIATVAGLLLRCLSRRKAGWDGRGRCKASWIARTFGISIPVVKAARRELVALGWIEPEDSDQWAMNRWGRAYRIDLGWDAPASDGVIVGDGVGIIATPSQTTGLGNGACQSPFPPHLKGESIPPFSLSTSIPPRPDPGSTFIPPDLHQEPSLSGGLKNQEPVPGPSGFSIEDSGRREEHGRRRRVSEPDQQVTPKIPSSGRPSPAEPLPAPRLVDVRVDDLKDTGRLLDLHRQAVAKGLVTASEADRLRFVGAAEHALAIASNPAALFAWLVLNRTWRFVTQAAEESGRRRLRVHDFPASQPALDSNAAPGRICQGIGSNMPGGHIQGIGPASSGNSTVGRMLGSGLSEDARIVREVRAAMIRAGIYRDPFPEVSRRYPEWTRERWDRAIFELGLA